MDHRHRYEFNLGPPSPEQLRFRRDIARHTGGRVRPLETNVQANKPIGGLALREAQVQRARQRAAHPLGASA